MGMITTFDFDTYTVEVKLYQGLVKITSEDQLTSFNEKLIENINKSSTDSLGQKYS